MTDYSFMKTGFNLNEESLDPDFMKKIQVLLEMFMEDALKASARYTIIKRKKVVNGGRMKLGLQYVARTFFDSEDMEERFAKVLNRDESEEDEYDEEDGEEEYGEEYDEEDGEEEDGEDDENDSGASNNQANKSQQAKLGQAPSTDKPLTLREQWRLQRRRFVQWLDS